MVDACPPARRVDCCDQWAPPRTEQTRLQPAGHLSRFKSAAVRSSEMPEVETLLRHLLKLN